MKLTKRNVKMNVVREKKNLRKPRNPYQLTPFYGTYIRHHVVLRSRWLCENQLILKQERSDCDWSVGNNNSQN